MRAPGNSARHLPRWSLNCATVRKELGELLKSEAELARRADMLKFQIEEIRSAKLKPGEDDELAMEQKRLANAETLAALADEAYTALYEGDGETPAALDALAQGAESAGRAGQDRSEICRAPGSTIDSVTAQIDDLAHEVQHYREAIEYSPKRLDAVEERLDLIKRLKRKYGAAHARCDARLPNGPSKNSTALEHSGERIDELRQEEDRLLREIGRAGKDLSEARKAAAEKLSAGDRSRAERSAHGRRALRGRSEMGAEPRTARTSNGQRVALRCDRA